MNQASPDELLAVAEEAAAAAGEVLREHFGGAASGIESKSTPTDLVSDADLAAENAVRRVLAQRRPGDALLSEEAGETTVEGDTAGSSDPPRLRWVVDPLDGTINFLFGIPVFAVSVACEDDEGTLAGVVLDPVRGESFTATRSGPAALNTKPLVTREAKHLARTMLATGFGYDAEVRARQAEVLTRVLPRVRDIRRAGAAALDLCWCACGRYDAYYERGVKQWDIAAGALIARRAGLTVRELPATDADPWGVLVASERIIAELEGLLLDGG